MQKLPTKAKTGFKRCSNITVFDKGTQTSFA